MAATHARAFAEQGRGWRAEEFAALLASAHVIAAGDADAFAVLRVVADEAEVLTVATDPARQRQGRARAALAAALAEATARGARRAFLEVAEDNAPARRFYAAEGFAQTGRRSGYYRRAGAAVDAVLMARAL
ncbi:GNAT family N-acetyltransferase [Roseovarius sp. SCSIO 43702]|nr:GNAT family N-acetyltransferase [Roseovarius sp. SCSIO 43702]